MSLRSLAKVLFLAVVGVLWALAPVAALGATQSLANRTERMIVGKKQISGACTYDFRLQLEPTEYAVEQREVWSNPITCAMKVERGTPGPAVQVAGLADELGDGRSEADGDPRRERRVQ
jgi:hypothetical protein